MFFAPCNDFLCTLEDNVFDFKFGSFRVRDMDSGTVLFDIERDYELDTEETRYIHYSFAPEFLELQTIGTTLFFQIGERPVQNLRMIERHYFRDRLLNSYDFAVNFCIPFSTNTWEAIYSLPAFTPDEKNEIIQSPYETKSDSFFFVEDVLIMHKRAEYDYSGGEY